MSQHCPARDSYTAPNTTQRTSIQPNNTSQVTSLEAPISLPYESNAVAWHGEVVAQKPGPEDDGLAAPPCKWGVGWMISRRGSISQVVTRRLVEGEKMACRGDKREVAISGLRKIKMISRIDKMEDVSLWKREKEGRGRRTNGKGYKEWLKAGTCENKRERKIKLRWERSFVSCLQEKEV